MDHIKGQCEHCGFCFKGTVLLNNGVFPELECPKCGEITENFDSASEVYKANKREDDVPDYNQVDFIKHQ